MMFQRTCRPARRSTPLVLATLLSLAFLAPTIDASRPVGATFTIAADQLVGPNPAYAVRVTADEAWGVWVEGCAFPADFKRPLGAAFQAYDIQQSAIILNDPLASNLGEEAALHAWASSVFVFDPENPLLDQSDAQVIVTLPEGGAFALSNNTEGTGGFCFYASAPRSRTWNPDILFVAALSNADPARSSFEVRLVGAPNLEQTWEAHNPEGAHFVVPREMEGPMVAANRFDHPPLPLLTNGGVQVGGVAEAHATRGIYGSFGYPWGWSEGAYAVVGPAGTYPSCSASGRNHCPASVLPAEQFAGGPGTYRMVNLASHTNIGHGLTAYWADLPLPDLSPPPSKFLNWFRSGATVEYRTVSIDDNAAGAAAPPEAEDPAGWASFRATIRCAYIWCEDTVAFDFEATDGEGNDASFSMEYDIGTRRNATTLRHAYLWVSQADVDAGSAWIGDRFATYVGRTPDGLRQFTSAGTTYYFADYLGTGVFTLERIEDLDKGRVTVRIA